MLVSESESESLVTLLAFVELFEELAAVAFVVVNVVVANVALGGVVFKFVVILFVDDEQIITIIV